MTLGQHAWRLAAAAAASSESACPSSVFRSRRSLDTSHRLSLLWRSAQLSLYFSTSYSNATVEENTTVMLASLSNSYHVYRPQVPLLEGAFPGSGRRGLLPPPHRRSVLAHRSSCVTK